MNSQGRTGKCMETLTAQEVSEASLMHTSLMHWCTFSTDAGETVKSFETAQSSKSRDDTKKSLLHFHTHSLSVRLH